MTFKDALTVLAVSCALALGAAPAQALTGELAPAISLPSLDGKTIKSPVLKDKRAALMVFWASW